MAVELIEAMGQDLTGLRDVPSAKLGARENVEILVTATGSGRAAGRALGLAESTLRGWRHGARPRFDTTRIVATARGAASARNRPGHYQDAYAGEKTLAINGLITVSSDSRIRTVHPGRNIPRAVMQGVVRAWSRGDDKRAHRLLETAIDTYYQPLQFDNILGAWFE